MNRRKFIKTGLIYIPTIFACNQGIAKLGNLDNEVYLWMVGVKSVSGNYTSKSVVANDYMIKALKANSLRSSIVRLGTFTGIGINSIKIPVIRDLSVGVSDTTFNFVDGDLTETGGLVGNGTTKFMESGVKQSELYGLDTTNHSISYGCYVCAGVNQSGFAMGTYDGTDFTYLYVSNGSGHSFITLGSSANQIDVVDANGLGFYCGSWNSTTDMKLYKGGAQIGTTATPGAVRNHVYWVGVFDANNQNNPVAVAPTTKTLGGYQCARGIAAASQPALNDIWKNTMRILGRPVN